MKLDFYKGEDFARDGLGLDVADYLVQPERVARLELFEFQASAAVGLCPSHDTTNFSRFVPVQRLGNQQDTRSELKGSARFHKNTTPRNIHRADRLFFIEGHQFEQFSIFVT